MLYYHHWTLDQHHHSCFSVPFWNSLELFSDSKHIFRLFYRASMCYEWNFLRVKGECIPPSQDGVFHSGKLRDFHKVRKDSADFIINLSQFTFNSFLVILIVLDTATFIFCGITCCKVSLMFNVKTCWLCRCHAIRFLLIDRNWTNGMLSQILNSFTMHQGVLLTFFLVTLLLLFSFLTLKATYFHIFLFLDEAIWSTISYSQ